MDRIEVYDIDGTICSSFFSNLNEKNDIQELKERIFETPLFPGFVKYYKLICRENNIDTYFITGRRYKDFGPETKLQLTPLGQELNLIFYPDKDSHSKFQYNCFRVYNILKISSPTANFKVAANSKVATEIHIYDDLCQYYPKLLFIAGKLGISNIRVHIVKDPAIFWNLKLNEVPLK